jgi:hypothetical protein
VEEEPVSILEQVSFIKLKAHAPLTVGREIFGNKNGRESTEKKAVNKDSTPRMSTMERLQVCMKACVAPPPDDPPLALDPSLLLSTAAPTPQPESVTSSSSGPSNAVPPPVLALSSEVPYPSTISTAAESSTTGLTTRNSEAFFPTTPQPLVPAARILDVPTSPLTDPEASIPLTPITNRKGKQPARSAKARGKRPALPDGEAEDMAAVGGHAGRGSKHRK